jgi:hypothetical protein
VSADGSNNMNYWVDFYSNDYQIDLSIEATLVDYGVVVTFDGFDEIKEDPEFRIEQIMDSEDNTYDLSEEEEAAVIQILNNVYWNETLYG